MWKLNKYIYISEFPTTFSTKNILSKKESEDLRKRNEVMAIFLEEESDSELLGFDIDLVGIFASGNSEI